jgi:glycine cleavage system H protein
MNFPTDVRYTKSDEWMRVEGDEAVAGLSDYAQSQLSDIVYVELPQPGESRAKGEAFGVVESVKAASDVYMPASGAIVTVNEDLSGTPELINQDPYGKAWLIRFKLDNPDELSDLMDAAAYEKYCEERTH